MNLEDRFSRFWRTPTDDFPEDWKQTVAKLFAGDRRPEDPFTGPFEQFAFYLCDKVQALKNHQWDRANHQILNEQLFRKLSEHREIDRSDELHEDAKDVATDGNPVIEECLKYGVLSMDLSGNLCFGVPIRRWELLFRSNCSEGFANFGAIYFPQGCHAQHFSDIQSLRHKGKTDDYCEKMTVDDWNDSSIDEASRLLLKWYDEVHRFVVEKNGVMFDNLSDASHFYKNITQLYHCSYPTQRSIHVFSTTSGLVIRDQFSGKEGKKLNGWRPIYFTNLRNFLGTLFYQLDPKTTWKGVQESPIKDEQVHASHFARYLQMENMELSETDFEQIDHTWRSHYTIVGEDGMVAYSSRNNKEQQNNKDQVKLKDISNGVIIQPLFWQKAGMETPFHTVNQLYHQQRKRILKPIGLKLSTSDALKHAKEIFRYWQLTHKT